MKIYKTNKKVLGIMNNPARFLNGISSNEMSKPRNAFLNVNGRIVATFDQVKINDGEYYLAIEGNYIDSVFEHIGRYVELSGAMVEEMDLNVYFDLEGHFPMEQGDAVIHQNKGKLLITDRSIKANVGSEEFTIFRVKNNIPMLGIDYKDEFLLNVSMTEFASFTKGCYLGQEPISKVYNRSKPTWRLVPKYEYECSEEEKQQMTSKIIDPMTGDVFGFVFEKND